MSIIIENEYEGEINIPYEKIAHEVIEAAIDYVDCPYECEVNLMLTDNETIHAINKEQREIFVTESAKSRIYEGIDTQKRFAHDVLKGFSNEEIATFKNIFEKICNNAEDCLKKK